MEQQDLFGQTENRIIKLDESAALLGVSIATIRNWIKASYLEPAGKGRVTLDSVERFRREISGKTKLNKRANKSQKDFHGQDRLASDFLERLARHSVDYLVLAAEYEDRLSDSYRNKEGVYYTPLEVVADMFPRPDGTYEDATFCDPCCGSGNFIERAIELGFKPENVFGFDVDPIAVAITKGRIYKLTGYTSENIRLADFLDTIKVDNGKFDFIYTNPPWGKKLPRPLREQYGKILKAGRSIDTCSLFFLACLQSLKEGGTLGLLLPDSFFNIANFEDARKVALDFSINRIVDYGKVFKGLLVKAQSIQLTKCRREKFALVSCEKHGQTRHERRVESFICNPKSIINMHCSHEEAEAIAHLLSLPHITLKGRASWGLGIVTGNNSMFIQDQPKDDFMPVYRGSDILQNRVKKPSCFIPCDLGLYQQVAPLHLYFANEKLIYKFISSKLCFFCDNEQKFILNSANMVIPDQDFPVPMKLLCQLLNSDFMNWIFTSIFNTHKVLRGDVESLPIHSHLLESMLCFDEERYVANLNMERSTDGTYRVKR